MKACISKIALKHLALRLAAARRQPTLNRASRRRLAKLERVAKKRGVA